MTSHHVEEQCRQGKLMCEACGKPMQMYYIPQCFHCTKPQGKPTTVVPLLPALYYIENQGHPDFKERFFNKMNYLTGQDNWSNDTYQRIVDIPASERSYEDTEILDLHDTLKSFYPDSDIVWWLSW